jgi:hypothetical protein
MGYESLEGRYSFSFTPAEDYSSGSECEWRDPVEVKSYVQSTFGGGYPEKGSDLLPYGEDNDPFRAFIETLNQAEEQNESSKPHD